MSKYEKAMRESRDRLHASIRATEDITLSELKRQRDLDHLVDKPNEDALRRKYGMAPAWNQEN